MWPTGMRELGIDVSGKIEPGLSAEPGRALGRLTDLGWGPRLRALLASDAPDAAAPDDLIAAVVKVLASWQWELRPTGVVSIPSRSRPQLISGLAAKIAGIGRMPYLGQLTYASADGESRRRGPAASTTALSACGPCGRASIRLPRSVPGSRAWAARSCSSTTSSTLAGP